PPMGSQRLDMPLAPSPGSGLTGQPPSGSILPPTSLLPPPPPSPVTKTPAPKKPPVIKTPAPKNEPPAKGADASKATKPATPAQSPPVLPENPFGSAGKSAQAPAASSPAKKPKS
ncbi:MAG: hypothetical protein ACP5XB_08350, partial [Isosphaeraceae bacterium]